MDVVLWWTRSLQTKAAVDCWPGSVVSVGLRKRFSTFTKNMCEITLRGIQDEMVEQFWLFLWELWLFIELIFLLSAYYNVWWQGWIEACWCYQSPHQTSRCNQSCHLRTNCLTSVPSRLEIHDSTESHAFKHNPVKVGSSWSLVLSTDSWSMAFIPVGSVRRLMSSVCHFLAVFCQEAFYRCSIPLGCCTWGHTPLQTFAHSSPRSWGQRVNYFRLH